MNYLDVYKARVEHLGSTPQERAYQSGILEFRRYLKYNSHTQYGLKSISNTELIEEAEEFESFDGVILTDKEDENRVSQILLVKSLEDGGPALKHGDLIKWNDEVWLIYQSTTSSYQPHQKFYMVRCQYFIKWVDQNGELQGSWIYLVGSKDSKIKDNFRTWHNVITPQPNKYINIIMPHQVMTINTEIMVLDEVWYLVDYDQNSVPNVVFMSFTETNLNLQRDKEGIANYDKLSKYSIEIAAEQKVQAGSEVVVEYNILKDGVMQQGPFEGITYTLKGNLFLKGGKIYATSSGTGTIQVNYKSGVSNAQKVIISDNSYIEPVLTGNHKIRLAQKSLYVLENIEKPQQEVNFSISDNSLASIVWEQNEKYPDKTGWYVIANDKNKLGKVTLIAEYEGNQYSKDIQIIPLWQVN